MYDCYCFLQIITQSYLPKYFSKSFNIFNFQREIVTFFKTYLSTNTNFKQHPIFHTKNETTQNWSVLNYNRINLSVFLKGLLVCLYFSVRFYSHITYFHKTLLLTELYK